MSTAIAATSSLALLPVTALKGVGPKLAITLTELKIHTVQDLLFHLPVRYEDRTRITSLAKAVPGSKILIEGQISEGHIQYGKRRSLLCRLSDGSCEIQLRFFHFNAKQIEQLTQVGLNLRCFGEVRSGYRGGIEMVHPEYRSQEKWGELPISDRLTPIYSTVAGVQQTTWRKLMQQALHLLQLEYALPELLPSIFLKNFNDFSLSEALYFLHQPPVNAPLDLILQGKHCAQQRLAFEELIAHQLGLLKFRHQLRHRKAKSFGTHHHYQKRFLATLPFVLTLAQQRVMKEINADLEKAIPMLRLVQGDVGSGKTVIAALALLQAVENQSQGALMAPTELLAEQHFQTLSRWLTPLGIRVCWLSGSQSEKVRREIRQEIIEKKAHIVVGTHALFQEKVHFADLSLLVIDEQHRFGVDQRLALKEKGTTQEYVPHQLIMTATPIPRTLAMTAYADLDVSVIDELPPGRKPIQTILLSNQRRNEVIERIRMNCKAGRQAYWVCTVIEDSEILQVQAAMALWQSLSASLPELTVGFVHGRLKTEEKEAVMAQFKAHQIDLLVATTVIEVGVDVPNATLMIIENAERLGLAQLHQLRGRVGRGQQVSYCVLLYQKPLSTIAAQRLQVIRDHQDGFYIAEQDLKIRGPGEVLGVRQTGLIRLKMADLLRDQPLLPQVQQASQVILTDHPDYVEKLLDRWLKGMGHYVLV